VASDKDLIAAIKKTLIEISHDNPSWRLLRGRESLSAEEVIGKLDNDKKFRKFVVTHYMELAVLIENRAREKRFGGEK
jgi:exoribonuclease R